MALGKLCNWKLYNLLCLTIFFNEIYITDSVAEWRGNLACTGNMKNRLKICPERE